MEGTAPLSGRPQNAVNMKNNTAEIVSSAEPWKSPQDHRQGKPGTDPGAVSKVIHCRAVA